MREISRCRHYEAVIKFEVTSGAAEGGGRAAERSLPLSFLRVRLSRAPLRRAASFGDASRVMAIRHSGGRDTQSRHDDDGVMPSISS